MFFGVDAETPSMSELTGFLDGIVHEPTQAHEGRVDLTVDGVARLEDGGAIDFGGDEHAVTDVEFLDPEHQNESEDYGWWELDGGTYLIEYNERLQAAAAEFQLQPLPRLLALGASHPTLEVSTLPRVPLSVPAVGVAIKENARVSTLYTGN